MHDISNMRLNSGCRDGVLMPTRISMYLQELDGEHF